MSENTFGPDQLEEARARMQARRATEWRTCRECNALQPMKEFNGRVIRHLESIQVSFLNSCKSCRSPKNVAQVAGAKKKDPAYARACRYWTASKRHGEPSDLKLKDVRVLLSCPCYYCKSRDSEMTVDRRDSGKGYTRTNSVSCCFRCNTLKSDMPLEAWKYILPAVQHATKIGLFSKWRENIPSMELAKARKAAAGARFFT